MAAKSLRCIAFAYRPLESSEDVPAGEEESSEWNQPDDNLVLMGICGIKVRTFLLVRNVCRELDLSKQS